MSSIAGEHNVSNAILGDTALMNCVRCCLEVDDIIRVAGQDPSEPLFNDREDGLVSDGLPISTLSKWDTSCNPPQILWSTSHNNSPVFRMYDKVTRLPTQLFKVVEDVDCNEPYVWPGVAFERLAYTFSNRTLTTIGSDDISTVKTELLIIKFAPSVNSN